MKKALLSLAVVGLMAASAQASTLSLRWAGTTDKKISLAPSATAVVEVVVDLKAGDSLSGGFFNLEGGPPVTHVTNTAGPANWAPDNGTTPNPVGPGAQFNVATSSNNLFGPLPGLVIGTITLHLDDAGDPLGTEYEIAISGSTNFALGNAAGSLFTFGPNFAAVVPGFFTLGQGSPGTPDIGLGATQRDPLIITVIPEPSTIALLAIGGFGVVMRRRRS